MMEVRIILCKSLSLTWEKLKNLTILSQTNKGVSVARNVALEVCKGKYVWMVDADDVINVSATRELLNELLNIYNFRGGGIYFDYMLYHNPKEYETPSVKMQKQRITEGFHDIDIFLFKLFDGAGMCWQFWLRRDIIMNNSLRFHEGANFFEDSHFINRYLCFCNQVYYKKSVLYYYRLNLQGAMRNSQLEDRHYCSVMLNADLNKYANRIKDKNKRFFLKGSLAISTAWCIREASAKYKNDLYYYARNKGLFPLTIYGTYKQKIQIMILNTNYNLYKLICKLI